MQRRTPMAMKGWTWPAIAVGLGCGIPLMTMPAAADVLINMPPAPSRTQIAEEDYIGYGESNHRPDTGRLALNRYAYARGDATRSNVPPRPSVYFYSNGPYGYGYSGYGYGYSPFYGYPYLFHVHHGHHRGHGRSAGPAMSEPRVARPSSFRAGPMLRR